MKSSLRKVTGFSPSQIAGIKVTHPMALAGEKQVDPSRRVVIQKDRLALAHDVEKSFEILTRYMAKAIRNNREEVENALIATGSPVSVRNVSLGRLNALVQNRLVQRDKNGKSFRQLMTALVASMYGRKLSADRFFRMPESMMGSNGETDELSSETDNMITLPPEPVSELETLTLEESTILPFARKSDGGVEKNKSDQDWGAILSGGAQVITAIGGVVGLFTGGQQANAEDNVFNTYNGGDFDPTNDQNKKNNKWVIWLVVIAVLSALGYFIYNKYYKK